MFIGEGEYPLTHFSLCTFSGMIVPCMLLYIFSRISYGVADSFYNSLLMFITSNEEEMNDASSKGYVVGYIGMFVTGVIKYQYTNTMFIMSVVML